MKGKKGVKFSPVSKASQSGRLRGICFFCHYATIQPRCPRCVERKREQQRGERGRCPDLESVVVPAVCCLGMDTVRPSARRRIKRGGEGKGGCLREWKRKGRSCRQFMSNWERHLRTTLTLASYSSVLRIDEASELVCYFAKGEG